MISIFPCDSQRTDVLFHQISLSLPPKSLKTPFRGPFNAIPIIERALRKSHVHGATKLKLYSYIGIGKYLGVCPMFSAKGRPGGTEPPNVNLGSPNIWKLLELKS